MAKPVVPWKDKFVTPDEVIAKIEPGSRIFLSTGVAEPRTLVRHLMTSRAGNLQDLELIQILSLGDAISYKDLDTRKFRLKTFYAGWVAGSAIESGRVDLIPSRFSRIPRLMVTEDFPIDVAFVRISPPDDQGYASLGVAVDIARAAMERATLVVGEISPEMPRTLGDTFVHVDDFHHLVAGTEPPIYFPRWPTDDVIDRVAANAASLVPDGACLAYSIGPIFESLAGHLAKKKDLGIHTPFVTDALMDLIESGAVTNRRKGTFRGKSLTAYALGSPALLRWLDRNPRVEFQGTDVVFDPETIGKNDRFVVILPARKADLTGGIALHVGKGNVAAGPGEAADFFEGAWLSSGGRTIFALPSRNREGKPNIRLSVEDLPNQFTHRESVDFIVTDHGVAFLKGRTVRERAQAMIDIAHPADRAELVAQAKAARILYPDQIFLAESAQLYPQDVAVEHTFAGGLAVHFRPIQPSDEDPMRRLFYRFSDQAVYYRYFSPIKTMPHDKMQQYVCVDYRRTMSIVGILLSPTGKGHVVAEARYVRAADRPYADVAFVVDEEVQGKGIAGFLYDLLIRLARARGIEGFTADVLATNKPMMRVFEKGPFPIKAHVDGGVYELTIPFTPASPSERRVTYTHG
jgi:acyl-CoA hydrolase/GNAT superfamily N-acetyltransferase